MTWLRIDDGFASHPKLAQLSDKEFRVWCRTLCFCARYQDPSVDAVALNEIPGLTKAMIAKFADLGLLDGSAQHREIHDWSSYQPKDATGAERQARWRARNGSSNGVSNEIDNSLRSVS